MERFTENHDLTTEDWLPAERVSRRPSKSDSFMIILESLMSHEPFEATPTPTETPTPTPTPGDTEDFGGFGYGEGGYGGTT